jgi:hypothetical protein
MDAVDECVELADAVVQVVRVVEGLMLGDADDDVDWLADVVAVGQPDEEVDDDALADAVEHGDDVRDAETVPVPHGEDERLTLRQAVADVVNVALLVTLLVLVPETELHEDWVRLIVTEPVDDCDEDTQEEKLPDDETMTLTLDVADVVKDELEHTVPELLREDVALPVGVAVPDAVIVGEYERDCVPETVSEGDVFAVTVPVLDVEIEVVYEPVTLVVAQFVTVALAPVETDGLRLWLVEMHAVVVAVLERLCDSEVVGETDFEEFVDADKVPDGERLAVVDTVCDGVVDPHTDKLCVPHEEAEVVFERLCDSEVVGEFDTDDVAVIVGDNDEETLPVVVTVCDDVVVSHTE